MDTTDIALAHVKLIRTNLTLQSAENNEKFVVSSGILARTFGFLDRCSTNWAIEPTGIGSESYPI